MKNKKNFFIRKKQIFDYFYYLIENLIKIKIKTKILSPISKSFIDTKFPYNILNIKNNKYI